MCTVWASVWALLWIWGVKFVDFVLFVKIQYCGHFADRCFAMFVVCFRLLQTTVAGWTAPKGVIVLHCNVIAVQICIIVQMPLAIGCSERI